MQAISSYRQASKTYRILYRCKYLHRLAKMVSSGWKITNLDLKFLIVYFYIFSQNDDSLTEFLHLREIDHPETTKYM